jgi:hypothetical protein
MLVGSLLVPSFGGKVMQKKQENMEYEPSLPPYVNYATGDTKDDMLIKPVLFVERNPGEDRSDYVNRCTEYL